MAAYSEDSADLRLDLPVAVIGGGIGGLTVALALSRIGRKVFVFEQASEIKPVGAGLQLGPNAFKILDLLELTPAVRAKATFPDDLLVIDGVSNREIIRIDVGDSILRRFGQPYAMMHRADLHEILLKACQASPKINLHAGEKLLSYEDTGQSVKLRTSHAGHLEVQALIGADGLWSSVRAVMVGDGPPRRSGHLCYRSITPAETIPADLRRNSMALWVGPRCSLVLWPMRQNQFYNVTAVFHSDRHVEGWDAHGDPQELFKGFAVTCPQVQDVLQRVRDWRFFVLSDRDPIRTWSKGRVTLLGDAAHPMQQYLAQGACMAMEDAAVLAAAVRRHQDDYEQAFLAYQMDRYLRTTRVQMTARLYGHVYHAEGAVADLRDQFLKSRTPDQTMESMAWLYEPALNLS